jgi:hypothetical protein
MITLNSLLTGFLAGLITFKVILLAVAAVLIVHTILERNRQRAAAPARARHHRLDVNV